jgi:hypothetical protein
MLTSPNTIALGVAACDIVREERDLEIDRSHLRCFPTLRIWSVMNNRAHIMIQIVIKNYLH